jgi:cytochrome c-type biogenesis protein CcmH/NrfF
MTLPVAHLGHWLWTFYVVPVLIVVLGIARSQLVQRRRQREEEDD